MYICYCWWCPIQITTHTPPTSSTPVTQISAPIVQSLELLQVLLQYQSLHNSANNIFSAAKVCSNSAAKVCSFAAQFNLRKSVIFHIQAKSQKTQGRIKCVNVRCLVCIIHKLSRSVKNIWYSKNIWSYVWSQIWTGSSNCQCQYNSVTFQYFDTESTSSTTHLSLGNIIDVQTVRSSQKWSHKQIKIVWKNVLQRDNCTSTTLWLPTPTKVMQRINFGWAVSRLQICSWTTHIYCKIVNCCPWP